MNIHETISHFTIILNERLGYDLVSFLRTRYTSILNQLLRSESYIMWVILTLSRKKEIV